MNKTSSLVIASVLVASSLLGASSSTFSSVNGATGCGAILVTSVTLSADMRCPGPGLTLGASGITLDCANHSIAGSGSYVGVNVTGVTNVAVKNCHLSNFEFALLVSSSNESTFSSDTVSGDSNVGAAIAWSHSDVFAADVAVGNQGGGFWFQFSDNITLSDDSATRNTNQGFDLEATSYTGITDSTSAFNSEDGFLVTTPFSPDLQDVLYNNSAMGNGNAGFDLQGMIYGLIRNNSAAGNQFAGFEIYGGDHNVLSGNAAENNSGYGGFAIWQTSGNLISSDNATGNGFTGFDLARASNNTLVDDIAVSNRYDGFRVEASAQNNTIRANSANSNSRYGILDNSTGSGVLGTWSTYAVNECQGNGMGNSSPSGLCSAPVAGNIAPTVSTIDSGQSIDLNADASGGTPPYSFHWYSGGACTISIGGNASILSVSPTYNFTYSYNARDSSPAHVTTACSQSSRVTVNPTLFATIEPLQGYIMPWSSVTLNVSVSGGTPPYSYQWFAGPVCIGRLNDTSKSYSAGALSGDRAFSVMVSDNSSGSPPAALCEKVLVKIFPIYLVLTIVILASLTAALVRLKARRGRAQHLQLEDERKTDPHSGRIDQNLAGSSAFRVDSNMHGTESQPG